MNHYKDFKNAVVASIREEKEIVLTGKYEKAKYSAQVLNFLGVSSAVIDSDEIIDRIVIIQKHDPKASIVIKPSRNAKGLLDVEIYRSVY